MITYFPSFYDDELVYSLFSRYHAQSGALAYTYTAEKLYKWKYCKPDIEFLNQLTEEARSILVREKSMEVIIEKHTMFPYYARFVSANRKEQAFQSLLNEEGNLKNILNLEYRSRVGGRFLRYCPICAAEDRKKYGETYWHRKHQIKGINICSEHKCYLKDSDILLLKKDKPQLTAAESIVPEVLYYTICESKREIQLAEYVTDVFQRDMDIYKDVEIGKFLSYQLSDVYRSETKLQRHLEKLYRDYKEYYKTIPETNVLTLPQIQKIFNGSLVRLYDICQLAMFEKIKVTELINPKPVEKPRNHIYEKVSGILGYDYQTVYLIGEAVLREYQKENRVQRKCGAVSLEWEKMDCELLPEVKINCLKIYEGDGGRPKKVTISAVQKLLQLPDKRLEHLPLCKAEILKYKESQQEYWAREIVWAYRKTVDNGMTVCWRRIRELTNMRNVDFQSCKPLISKYTDEETAAIIINLL